MSSGRLSEFFHIPHFRPSAQRSERDSWPEVTATVADSLNLSGMWDKSKVSDALYSVRFTYWVERQMFTGCFKTRTRYAAGDLLQVRHDPIHPERNSADPEEKLRTELLIAAAIGLAALYFAVAWHW